MSKLCKNGVGCGGVCKKICEKQEISVPELIEKAKYLCKVGRQAIDELMTNLTNPAWIQRYTGDPVILKYSCVIRKLRQLVQDLRKTYTEAENKILLKNLKNFFDERLTESLKSLNNSIECELREFSINSSK